MGFWENVKQFNERWNDLPRRGAIVLMVLLALLVFAALFSYIAPSVIAMVLAWVIHPVARRLENVFRKIKLPAKLASLIAVVVMYGVVSFILFWIGARVVEEMRSLIAALPGWVSQASDSSRNGRRRAASRPSAWRCSAGRCLTCRRRSRISSTPWSMRGWSLSRASP